jgi:hypothetical protein
MTINKQKNYIEVTDDELFIRSQGWETLVMGRRVT